MTRSKQLWSIVSALIIVLVPAWELLYCRRYLFFITARLALMLHALGWGPHLFLVIHPSSYKYLTAMSRPPHRRQYQRLNSDLFESRVLSENK